jgi:5-methyltetrahydropteroyltriglutamate--homocysteine methyltransferase
VEITLHLCCGYPDVLDNPSFPRASASSYLTLAPHLDRLPCAIIALEDARCRNDLSMLHHFREKRVALGAVSVTSTRVESAGEIVIRAREALQYLPMERLVLAPDCGMGMLPWNVATKKLRALGEAAQLLGQEKSS